MIQNIIISAVVAGLVAVSAWFLHASPAPIVNTNPDYGAVTGPTIQGNFLTVGNLTTWRRSSGLNQASTTLCALQAPASTSTLEFASIQLTTGTTTGIDLDLAKSTSPSASTTLLGTTYIYAGSNAKDTVIASTSPAGGNAVIFGPNQYFIVKYGGAVGSSNVLVGNCKASWFIN